MTVQDADGQEVLAAGGWGKTPALAVRMALHVMCRRMSELVPASRCMPVVLFRRLCSATCRAGQHVPVAAPASAGALPGYSIQHHLRQHIAPDELPASLYGQLAKTVANETAHVPGLPPPVLLGKKHTQMGR